MIDKVFKVFVIFAIVLYFGAPACVGFMAGYDEAVLRDNMKKGG